MSLCCSSDVGVLVYKSWIFIHIINWAVNSLSYTVCGCVGALNYLFLRTSRVTEENMKEKTSF